MWRFLRAHKNAKIRCLARTTRADLSSSGTAKPHKSWNLARLYMSFAIAEKPRLPRRTFPLTAMCLLTAFSACDSIHKHPCSTLVMCTRMFAICPPLSCYPQHSALLRGLDHTFGLSLLLWALSFPTVPTLFKPVLPTQTPQLDSHKRPQPEGHRRCAMLYNYIELYYLILVLYFITSDHILAYSSKSYCRSYTSTRTRRGGSCLRGIYIYIYIIRPFSSIELACAVRQPSPCVRAFCESGVLFLMSHLKLHFTSHFSLHSPHTPHFTLHTPHFTLRTALFALHTSLHTSHFTLHTSHFTLHTSHFTLHTSHFTLHTSHCTLLAPHFTLHPSHSTLHLIWALLTLSQLISSHLISSHISSKLSWITSQY